MKLLYILVVSCLIPASSPVWLTDFEVAKKEAASTNKLILLSFSGSDWCSHCMRMKKGIWDNACFENYASQKLVLVNADFPRMKKNKLADEQVKKNEKLSEVYNPKGVFPLTLLVNGEGKVLKKWEGDPKMSCEEFTGEINKVIDANRR